MLDQWVKCEKCLFIINRADLEENLWVCPKCNYHFYITAQKRIEITFTNFQEYYKYIKPLDFLAFPEYHDKLIQDQKKLNLMDGIITGLGYIKEDIENNYLVAVAVMEFHFRGGSMGSVIGEKLALITEEAISREIPLIVFSASGGARMQEGIVALMQMAKTVSVINKLKSKRIPFINVALNPTTGGVAASFVAIADIIIAEPGAIIGFAGQRVIEQTIKKKLPPNFQSSEFNLNNGLIDQIVERKKIPLFLYNFIKAFYFWK